MGRRPDIHFAIDEHVQAHRRDGFEIDLTKAAIRISTAIGPCGLVINDIEALVANAAEKAGVPIREARPLRETPRGSLSDSQPPD
jgi:hypothetical protein